MISLWNVLATGIENLAQWFKKQMEDLVFLQPKKSRSSQ